MKFKYLLFLIILPYFMVAHGALRSRENINREWTFTFGNPADAETVGVQIRFI